jgi:hypothetical protein
VNADYVAYALTVTGPISPWGPDAGYLRHFWQVDIAPIVFVRGLIEVCWARRWRLHITKSMVVVHVARLLAVFWPFWGAFGRDHGATSCNIKQFRYFFSVFFPTKETFQGTFADMNLWVENGMSCVFVQQSRISTPRKLGVVGQHLSICLPTPAARNRGKLRLIENFVSAHSEDSPLVGLGNAT